jgi:hypothetical protein
MQNTTTFHSKRRRITRTIHDDDVDLVTKSVPLTINRRDGILRLLVESSSIIAVVVSPQSAVLAYTPDSDPLRESLYLISRVQEATVQQERYIDRVLQQEILQSKMKLTLRLVEKNYRLLDQITYASEYIIPSSSDSVIDATTAGYEAAEALQNAIDYVNSNNLGVGELKDGQREYLKTNLQICRERLFDFLVYMPCDKLDEARRRVEEENIANRDEFDGDADAGVYNPVVIPWKKKS